MQATSLEHRPEGAWVFDEEVTSCFDDMLTRSIPQYDVMRDAVYRIARAFLPPGGWVVDLGTSRGESVARLVEHFGAQINYTLVETSPPMLAAVRERYRGYIEAGVMRVFEADVRKAFPREPAHVVQSVLTLQFVPINYRQQIVQSAYDTLRPGGAFILVEKVLGAGSRLDDLMVTNYHALKSANGYSYDAIDRKRESLEGVLVPVTAKWNEDLLRESGFRHVDCFWRWMNFAAWVAVK